MVGPINRLFVEVAIVSHDNLPSHSSTVHRYESPFERSDQDRLWLLRSCASPASLVCYWAHLSGPQVQLTMKLREYTMATAFGIGDQIHKMIR